MPAFRALPMESAYFPVMGMKDSESESEMKVKVQTKPSFSSGACGERGLGGGADALRARTL